MHNTFKHNKADGDEEEEGRQRYVSFQDGSATGEKASDERGVKRRSRRGGGRSTRHGDGSGMAISSSSGSSGGAHHRHEAIHMNRESDSMDQLLLPGALNQGEPFQHQQFQRFQKLPPGQPYQQHHSQQQPQLQPQLNTPPHEPMPLRGAPLRVVNKVLPTDTFQASRTRTEVASFLDSVFFQNIQHQLQPQPEPSSSTPQVQGQRSILASTAPAGFAGFDSGSMRHVHGVARHPAQREQLDDEGVRLLSPSRMGLLLGDTHQPANSYPDPFQLIHRNAPAYPTIQQQQQYREEEDRKAMQQDLQHISGSSEDSIMFPQAPATFAPTSSPRFSSSVDPEYAMPHNDLSQRRDFLQAPINSAPVASHSPPANKQKLVLPPSLSSVASSKSNTSNLSSTSVATNMSAGSGTASVPAATGSASTPSRQGVQFRKYQADMWATRFEQLTQYKQKYGHCQVETRQDKALARWMKRQRCQYKLKIDGRRSTLTDERQQKLEGLGFVWDSHEITWERHYRDLVAYQAQMGHCNVPSKYADDPSLGTWVKDQRRKFRLLKSGQGSSLTAGRIELLNKVGFCWDTPLPSKSPSRQRESP